MPRDLEKFGRHLKAVADPERLRILSLLPTTAKCDLVCNVSELSQELGLSQPTVSHHLGVLRNAGLVKFEKMCRDVYYWVDARELEKLATGLTGLAKRKA